MLTSHSWLLKQIEIKFVHHISQIAILFNAHYWHDAKVYCDNLIIMRTFMLAMLPNSVLVNIHCTKLSNVVVDNNTRNFYT